MGILINVQYVRVYLKEENQGTRVGLEKSSGWKNPILIWMNERSLWIGWFDLCQPLRTSSDTQIWWTGKQICIPVSNFKSESDFDLLKWREELLMFWCWWRPLQPAGHSHYPPPKLPRSLSQSVQHVPPVVFAFTVMVIGIIMGLIYR